MKTVNKNDIKKILTFSARAVPLFCLIPLACSFLENIVFYALPSIMTNEKKAKDISGEIDEKIPFRPTLFFVGAYVSFAIFWSISYIIVAKEDKDEFYRFYAGNFWGKAFCALFYYFLPTTMVRPIITGNSLAENYLSFIYKIDKPLNLFPSMHCFVTWYGALGIMDAKKVSPVSKLIYTYWAGAIIASTVLVKQHTFWDVPSGILIAQGAYMLRSFNSDWIKNIFEGLNERAEKYISE